MDDTDRERQEHRELKDVEKNNEAGLNQTKQTKSRGMLRMRIELIGRYVYKLKTRGAHRIPILSKCMYQ